MKSAFLDANVVIDVLLERQPFLHNALLILSLADKGFVNLICSPLSLGTASYLMERNKISSTIIKDKMKIFSEYSKVSIVDEAVVQQSIDSDFEDFEDALQYFSAVAAGADCIVTRNKQDFAPSAVPVYWPGEFVDMVKGQMAW